MKYSTAVSAALAAAFAFSTQPVLAKNFLRDVSGRDEDHRTLAKLEQIGNNGKGGVFPLPKCKGDCDNDGECAGILICFKRGKDSGNKKIPANAPVPGCYGKAANNIDYCVHPDDVSTQPHPTPRPQPHPTPGPKPSGGDHLVSVGNNWKPKYAYPLGKCEGDCDSNKECAGNLICFQRTKRDPWAQVPGCNGRGSKETDYCIDPKDDQPETRPTPKPTPKPTPHRPRPTHKPTPKPTPYRPRPTHKPTPKPTPYWSRPTHKPTPRPYWKPPRPTPRPTHYQRNPNLSIVALFGEPARAYPLGLCQGDCDTDGDCRGHLVCFRRNLIGNAYASVPGCDGSGVVSADYCVDPRNLY